MNLLRIITILVFVIICMPTCGEEKLIVVGTVVSCEYGKKYEVVISVIKLADGAWIGVWHVFGFAYCEPGDKFYISSQRMGARTFCVVRGVRYEILGVDRDKSNMLLDQEDNYEHRRQL